MPQFQKIAQTRDYNDHCWLGDERLVAGTQKGEFIVLENFEEKQFTANAFNTGGIVPGAPADDA